MCQEVNEQLQNTISVPSDPVRIKEEPKDDDYESIEDELESYNFGELIADEDMEEPPVDESMATEEPIPPETETQIARIENIPPRLRHPSWKCIVCSVLVPQTIHLKDHLKEHYSEEVSLQGAFIKTPLIYNTSLLGPKMPDLSHVIQSRLQSVPACNGSAPGEQITSDIKATDKSCPSLSHSNSTSKSYF